MRTFATRDTELEQLPHPPGTGAPFVYDLRVGGDDSRHFYPEVKAFSGRVVAQIESRASAVLDGYSRYVADVVREAPRSRGEYALELLTVGMAIRLYGDRASSTPRWVVALGSKLFRLRGAVG